VSRHAHAERNGTFLLALLLVSLSPALSAQSELVVVRKDAAGKSQYHRPGCPVVRDTKDVLAMTRAEAESRGSKAHGDCDPATASATGAPAGSAAGEQGGSSAAEEPVFVDAAGSTYHRHGCTKIGAGERKVLLKDVGKRWPCSSCRPPIRRPTGTPLVPGWRPGKG
jgi:hypothetical protein